MQQPQIFISYRRDDAAGYARAVNDELVRCFGAERVFIDVDDINAGQPFSEIIQRSVGDSAVLLALIGKRWRGDRDDATPRIFEADDFVRQEIAAGLAKGLRVIPVLLDGVAMPEPAQLPPDLKALAGHNALELDNARFAADMERLVREVRGALGDKAAPVPVARTASSRTGWWIGAAAAAVAVAAIATWWQSQRTPAPLPSARVETAPAAARAQVNGDWQADVTYDWDNARFSERFRFAGAADALHGSASFLGVARLRHPHERIERRRRQRHDDRAPLPRPAGRRRAPLRHADRGRQLDARADRVRRAAGAGVAGRAMTHSPGRRIPMRVSPGAPSRSRRRRSSSSPSSPRRRAC
jgi:hypothetical protein